MKHSIRRLLVAAAALVSSVAVQADDIVVVVNRDYPLDEITAEQLKEIYLGSNTRLRAIDLPDSDRLRHWFYFKVTGRDQLQVDILRARHMDTWMRPKVAKSSADAVRRVAANKGAIAYVDRAAVDASVKIILSIDKPDVLDNMHAHD